MADFAQFVTEQIPRLRRYARALVGTQRADDLVQDCLERAWSRRRLWDGQGELRAWLFTILHHLYVNGVRRQASAPAFEPLPEEEPPALAPSRHEAALDLRDVQRALDGLSLEHREVVLLVGLEQLDYAEVATILNVPPGTVMSRLARACEALRLALQEPPRARLRRIKKLYKNSLLIFQQNFPWSRLPAGLISRKLAGSWLHSHTNQKVSFYTVSK